MSISLVSTPVLGFDLVRHPAGSEIADILLSGLTLGPDDLRLFTPAPGRVFLRRTCWRAVHEVIDNVGPGSLPGTLIPQTAQADDDAAVRFAAIADTLIRSMIVDLDDLEKLIRDDVLVWTSAPTGPRGVLRSRPRGDDLPDTELVRSAGDALIDAIAARWITGIDSDTRTALSTAFTSVQTQLPSRTADVGPCADDLQLFLEQLGSLGPDGRQRLRTVAELLRAVGSEWAQAVHEASWAAMATGRIRAAAAAQLQAVQAFIAAGFDAADGAEGLWNTVSGHVQATAVSDVLPESTLVFLTRTWNTALARS